ncbi:MAG: BatD family protein, partial [Bacteroidia bacterium]
KKSLKTSPTSLDILPYPLTDQPSDFSGLTGDFSMKTEITKSQVEANEAVNLKITISGTGNMKQVNAPDLEFPPDIEAYDPKTVDNIKVGATAVSGSRTFDYLLIPRHAGEFKLGPFSFSYFDAAKGKYVTLSQPEFTLKVGKGNGEEDKATGVTIASKEDLKVLGSDIRYIKTNEANVTEKGKYFFRSPLFFALSGAPVLLYLGFFLWHRNMVKQSGNVALMKSRRANKIAGKRLALAKKFLQEKKKNEYYEEIFKALWGYISDKLSIPVAELTKEKIKETMLAKNVNEATINEFISLLDKAEFARFAPAEGEREMDTVYTESVNVISKIEGNV